METYSGAVAWTTALGELRACGLLRDVEPEALGSALRGEPTPEAIATLMRAYYRAPDAVERAWRTQSERYLELPVGRLRPDGAVAIVRPLVPEEALDVARTPSALEVRLGPASVGLRSVVRHARREVVRHVPLDAIDGATLVAAVNVLLEQRRHARRFVPLIAPADLGAWVMVQEPVAVRLHGLGLLAMRDARDWRAFARYNAPSLRLAS